MRSQARDSLQTAMVCYLLCGARIMSPIKKLSTIVLIVASAAVVPSFATGGEVANQTADQVKFGLPPYTVQDGIHLTRMSGSMMAARNSADTKQFIRCMTQATVGTTINSGWCEAKTATGWNAFRCYTNDPNLLATMRAINATSHVAIDYQTFLGNCVKIEITNDSRNVLTIGTPPTSPSTTTVGGFQ
jgi:hypothetical protein